MDGDIVLVIGMNGQGKTSLFDAIHWAITGEISRLNHPGSVVSLYSPSGEARVLVTLTCDDGRLLEVVRHSDGERDSLLVSDGDETFRGEDAEYELLRRLWPEGLTSGESRPALTAALERGVYLQQDVLTGFLTADTDHDRFNAISELIGAGRTTEFQSALERSRRAWTRITTQRSSEMHEKEQRLDRLEGQLRELVDASSAAVPSSDEWVAWWTQAKGLGVSSTEVPRIDSSDAHRVIDIAMAELRSLRLSLERRRDRLRNLALMLDDLPSVAVDLDALRGEVDESAHALDAVRRALDDAQEEAAESRRMRLQSRSEEEDRRTLAGVTLRYLGETCPVCQQPYDIEATRERLEAWLQDASKSLETSVSEGRLRSLLNDIGVIEERASRATAALQTAQLQERMLVESQERIHAGLIELGLKVPEVRGASRAIESALKEATSDLKELSEAGLQGEALALSLARTGQLARQAEVQEEVRHARRDLSNIQGEIARRQETGDLVSRMIEGLRGASAELVQRELVRLDPLLQRIYATADPHPEFRIVKLLSRMYGGKGRVFAEVKDPLNDHQSEAPTAYLSSSQMNVLALSVFLALNLGIPTLPLSVSILDDPLQSLDDLNLLGLIDLLKRMRERRQLMVSTHDSRFASLLERKLRPVSDFQRTILVELSGWSSEGPMVTQRDVEGDVVPIRIAAA